MHTQQESRIKDQFMRLFRPLAIASCCIMMSIAHATPIAPTNYPADLKYKDNFIDPSCFTDTAFFQEDYRLGYVELNKCSPTAPKLDTRRTGTFAYYPAHDYIGYPEDKDPENRFRTYHYYRVFNAAPGYYFVESEYSGGGSGIFTSIDLITRIDSSTFTIQNITNGDRCNGGLGVDDDTSAHKLTYKQNFTPYEMVLLSDVPIKDKKLLEGLYFCANCCIVFGYYEVNDSGKNMLQYLDIEGYSKFFAEQMKYAEKTSNEDPQFCFNTVLSSYLKRGKTKLNADELNGFVNEFIKSCGHDKS